MPGWGRTEGGRRVDIYSIYEECQRLQCCFTYVYWYMAISSLVGLYGDYTRMHGIAPLSYFACAVLLYYTGYSNLECTSLVLLGWITFLSPLVPYRNIKFKQITFPMYDTVLLLEFKRIWVSNSHHLGKTAAFKATLFKSLKSVIVSEASH